MPVLSLSKHMFFFVIYCFTPGDCFGLVGKGNNIAADSPYKASRGRGHNNRDTRDNGGATSEQLAVAATVVYGVLDPSAIAGFAPARTINAVVSVPGKALKDGNPNTS